MDWIDASEWGVAPNSFNVRADIGRLLQEHGHRVYSVMVSAPVNGAGTPISLYSIFHGIPLQDEPGR